MIFILFLLRTVKKPTVSSRVDDAGPFSPGLRLLFRLTVANLLYQYEPPPYYIEHSFDNARRSNRTWSYICVAAGSKKRDTV